MQYNSDKQDNNYSSEGVYPYVTVFVSFNDDYLFVVQDRIKEHHYRILNNPVMRCQAMHTAVKHHCINKRVLLLCQFIDHYGIIK
jgi:hypothetical protein